MKKWTALLLIFTMFFSAPVYGNYKVVEFSDLSRHWIYGYQDVLYLLQHLEIAGGYPDGTYKPGNNITREEFIKMLVVALGEEVQLQWDTQTFSDVGPERWSHGYIETAVHRGILIPSDYGNSFIPETPITRQEIAVMIVRALKLPIENQNNSRTVFKDDEDIPVWAKPYIHLAYSNGIINGYKEDQGASFKPSQTASRAEAAIMVYRFLCKKKHLKKVGYYAIDSFQQVEKANLFDEIIFGWGSLDKFQDGTIIFSTDNLKSDYHMPVGYEQALNIVEGKNVDRKFMVTETRTDLIYTFLENEKYQKYAIEDIISVLREHNFSGIVVDFENIRNGQKGYRSLYVKFLENLKEEIQINGFTLSVTVQPNNVLGFYDGYDYKQISRIADELILMGHDYHEPKNMDILTDHAPIQKVKEALSNLIQEGVSREKIILGIQVAAGTQWITTSSDEQQSTSFYTPSMTAIYNALRTRQGEKGFDYLTMTPYFSYTTVDKGKNIRRIIKYENEKSVRSKILLAKFYGIKGISIWRLGEVQEDITELMME